MATHTELMTALKFDESFKNALRDYYSYGFKGLKSYDPKRADTLQKDWSRLNNILRDYMEWSKGKDKDFIMYASQNSLSMAENPFHRLYRFCKFNHKDAMTFFNIIFALSDAITIAGNELSFLSDRLGIDLMEEAKKRSYYHYIDYIKRNHGRCIKLNETKPTYILEAEDGKYTRISERDIIILKSLLAKWNQAVKANPTSDVVFVEKMFWESLDQDLRSKAKTNSYKRYIEFLKNNIDKQISVKEKGAVNCQLFVDDSNYLVIPRKDEAFVKKLFLYWNFVKQHPGAYINGEGVIVGKNGNKTETLKMPAANIDEYEMARKLVEGGGRIEIYEKIFLDNMKAFFEDEFEAMLNDIGKREGLSTSQLPCFYPNDAGLFSGDNASIYARLSAMEGIGILRRTAQKGPGGKAVENRWALHPFVLEDLIEEGRKCSDESDQDFEIAFQTALDFYSRYFVLGACGTFLQDRIGSNEKSPFRFKHEYFMQALNDFNLIDVLYVIEHQKWCEIQYRHGTANFKSTLLCKPIEVKVSASTGRQFLVFYNPVKRSCTNLRLEFIEEITAYDEEKVLKALEKRHISKQTVEADLANAVQALKYTWGVSVSGRQKQNVKSAVLPKKIQFQISYDTDKELYIKNRVIRESRGVPEEARVKVHAQKGIVSFEAYISDPKEMRPWLRSFYSRVRFCSGMETKYFSLLNDVERCLQGMEKLEKKTVYPPERWLEKEATVGRIEKGKKVRAHEALFNEVFNVYYYIIAEVLIQCCSKYGAKGIALEKLDDVVKKVQGWYEQKKGIKTDKLSDEEIKWLLENNAFGKIKTISGKKEVFFKYECDCAVEFYRNILPLTILEIRWLKTILADSKIRCFLTDRQIEGLTRLLEQKFPDVKAFPMKSIVFFDRHIKAPRIKEAERLLTSTITKAVYEELLLTLSYTTKQGNELTGKFKPLVLEYSKRNDKFQACFQSCKNNRFYYINMAQINDLRIDDEGFDYFEALEEYEKYRKRNERSVKLEFYDVKNLADRLLTEFSPWRKYCMYHPDTELYSLEIFYQKMDETDIVVRLMGYGADIHIADKEHSIAKEILLRLQKQRELLVKQFKNKEIDDSER